MYKQCVMALLALLLVAGPVGAQETRTDAVTFAGNGISVGLVSIGNPFKVDLEYAFAHYDRWLSPHLGLGVGLSVERGNTCAYVPPEVPDLCNLIVTRVPVTLSRFWADRSHNFEAGGGVMLGYSAPNAPDAIAEGFVYALALRIGYRYQPRDGGLFFTVTWRPLLFGNDGEILATGFGIGYAF